MKEKKRFLALYSFYDRSGIEAFLEEKAENGWLLEKMSAFGWVFRRIEPKKIKFSVSYFAKASAFDPYLSEEQLRFHDFCEHTGWKLAASSAQIQIFYNESENPTPIETDGLLEVEALHKAVKKGFLPSYLLLFAVSLMQCGLFSWRFFEDPISILSNHANLFAALCWMISGFIVAVELGTYFFWYRKAKKIAELEGIFLETKSHKNLQLLTLFFMIGALVLMLGAQPNSKMLVLFLITIVVIIGMTAIILLVSELMKRMKVKAKTNRMITILLTIGISFGFVGILLMMIVGSLNSFWDDKIPTDTYEFQGQTYEVYGDEIPLKLEDLAEVEYEGYSYELWGTESFLTGEWEATQRPRWDALEEPDLDYTFIDVKLPALYSLCKNAALKDFTPNYGWKPSDGEPWEIAIEIDGYPWGANEAYQLLLGEELQQQFLLCYDKRIVEIDFEHDWILTDEQKSIVGEKLSQ